MNINPVIGGNDGNINQIFAGNNNTIVIINGPVTLLAPCDAPPRDAPPVRDDGDASPPDNKFLGVDGDGDGSDGDGESDGSDVETAFPPWRYCECKYCRADRDLELQRRLRGPFPEDPVANANSTVVSTVVKVVKKTVIKTAVATTTTTRTMTLTRRV